MELVATEPNFDRLCTAFRGHIARSWIFCGYVRGEWGAGFLNVCEIEFSRSNIIHDVNLLLVDAAAQHTTCVKYILGTQVTWVKTDKYMQNNKRFIHIRESIFLVFLEQTSEAVYSYRTLAN